MKQHIVILTALLLSACGGAALPVREFFQDKQNDTKFNELSAKFKKEHGCDKLEKLYKFTRLENPTVKDLSEIMPIFGLKADDAKNVNKVYNLDLSVMNKYNCDDVGNKDQLINELVQYCDAKYHDTPDKQSDCEYYLKQSIFVIDEHHALTWSILDKRQAIQNVKDTLETDLVNNVQKIYPLPEDTDKLLPDFSASELIKARKEVLGTYDGNCYGDLCENEVTGDKTVTRLNAARILYSFCKSFAGYFGDQSECACYAHQTYKKVNYKNLIYIDEQSKLPTSKKAEFDQIFKKCKQKLEKQRYGEVSGY